ncbi:MAG TPA: TetR/AcrR family transcriptional regulator [Acidimicrobiales bacterium]|nr:TetR/AcrR family transcriptional regulator [Acidimicrobiales bacterium]
MARPGDQTKARIVAAALESLHEEGILGASARAIAKRGDFNQGLIFYHFGSLTDLLLAAVDELSTQRADRYEQRLEEVSTLPELVRVAGELHREDMEQGHITVLSQMLAAAATDHTLRAPMRERFDPWIEIVERTIVRALGDTPYAQVVPAHDLAFAITSLFIGLELFLNLEDETERDDSGVFTTFELLGSMLQAMLTSLPPPAPA